MEKDEERAEKWAKEQGRRLASRQKRERLHHIHQQAEVYQINTLQITSKRKNTNLEREIDLQYAKTQAKHAQHTTALQQLQEEREREGRRRYREELGKQVRSRKREDSGVMSPAEAEMNREGLQAARLGLPALWMGPGSPFAVPSAGREYPFRGFSQTPSPAKHSSMHYLPL